MKTTLTTACVVLGMMAGAASAGVAVMDSGERYTGTAIAFSDAVQEIDFSRQMVNIQYPGSVSQVHTYNVVPCSRNGYFKMLVWDRVTNPRVFTVISSCFSSDMVPRVTQGFDEAEAAQDDGSAIIGEQD